MRYLIALLCLLAGCATPAQPVTQNTRTIERVMLPQIELEHVCGKAVIGQVAGCFKDSGAVCTVYIRPLHGADDRQWQYVFGHESLHCYAGNFHASMDY